MSKRSKQFAKQYKVHKKRIHRLRKHPFIVPVITFLVLFFVCIALVVSLGGTTIGPDDARVVNVYVDGKEQILPTRAPTVGDLLTRLDIKLGEKDVVEPAADTPILDDNFRVNVYRAKPVTVSEGERKVTVLTTKSNPSAIAKDAGFKVFPEDEVVPASPQQVLRQGVVGQQYVVDRAPIITINLYGSPIQVRTNGKTVGQVLKDKNIKTQSNDTIVPNVDTAMTPTTVIAITNPNKQVITVEEPIEMPVETIDDPALPAGSKVVKTVGSPGKKVVTYDLKLENGKEVGRTPIQVIITADPVKQVVAKGTKVVSVTGSKAEWMAGAGISPSDYQYVDFVIGHESGWRPGAVSANRCIGLGQSCSGSLAGSCPDWQSNPVCQLKFFSGYARRYGGWSGAYSEWQRKGWW
jgi:uncharacterized protein YabE (DUF348 family)